MLARTNGMTQEFSLNTIVPGGWTHVTKTGQLTNCLSIALILHSTEHLTMITKQPKGLLVIVTSGLQQVLSEGYNMLQQLSGKCLRKCIGSDWIVEEMG